MTTKKAKKSDKLKEQLRTLNNKIEEAKAKSKVK